MKLKLIVWILTLLGILPAALFLSMFVRVFPISEMPLRSMLDTRAWNWQMNVYGNVFETGNRISDPTAKTEIKLYPRLWTLLIGVFGALLLLIFTVYTLHIPYK